MSKMKTSTELYVEDAPRVEKLSEIVVGISQ
jgi:hypothetical protein